MADTNTYFYNTLLQTYEEIGSFKLLLKDGWILSMFKSTELSTIHKILNWIYSTADSKDHSDKTE
jgi:hypothetical protein